MFSVLGIPEFNVVDVDEDVVFDTVVDVDEDVVCGTVLDGVVLDTVLDGVFERVFDSVLGFALALFVVFFLIVIYIGTIVWMSKRTDPVSVYDPLMIVYPVMIVLVGLVVYYLPIESDYFAAAIFNVGIIPWICICLAYVAYRGIFVQPVQLQPVQPRTRTSRSAISPIVFVGLQGAGKSCLLQQLMIPTLPHHRRFIDEYVPTPGLVYKYFHLDDIQYEAWDLGGSHEVRLGWSYFVRQAKVVVFVIDAVTIFTMKDEVKNELHNLVFGNDLMSTSPLIVMFNKMDESFAIDRVTAMEYIDYNKLVEKLGYHLGIFFVSAKTGVEYHEAMRWAISKCGDE